MTNTTHKFDVAHAAKYGIEKAILLEHLIFHQSANEGNDDLTFNGKPYAFIKPSTIKKMYPYLNYSSVRRWLKELEDDGVIESIKPEASGGYHLKYYHVCHTDQSNDQNDQSKNDQNDQSSILPNSNTNMNKSSSNIPDVDEVKDYFSSNGYSRDAAQKFYDYYNASIEDTDKRIWRDSKGNKVRNWKQKAQAVWFKEENKDKDVGGGISYGTF